MKTRATTDSNIIVLAAGGTGGHIFPAVALAEVLRARGFEPHLITDARFHHYHTVSGEDLFRQIPIHTVAAGSPSGGLGAKIRATLQILRGTWQAYRLLKRLKPRAVVGFGGYPSFPTLFAAILRRERTILHEQNAVLGRVNRALAGWVSAIATSYRDTLKMPPRAHAVHTGNPVRAGVLALANVEYPALSEMGFLRLLVIGGSQGASVFSEVLPEAMKRLPADLRARIRLDQQCRGPEMESVRAKYHALGMQVELAPFFSDVALRLAGAHLVITRAGASSVAELVVMGRPAILVPLPIATDNHQYHNAQAIEISGAGWVVSQPGFTPDALAARLETLMRVPERLTAAAANMHRLAQGHAAELLAALVVQETV